MIPPRFGGIAPWDIVYGAEPFEYELSTADTKFNYDLLTKPTEPIPPRSAVPDMNKHKAKKDKQMKLSGLKLAYDDSIDDNEEKEEVNGLRMNNVTKSAPIIYSKNNNFVDDEKNNN